MALRTFFLAFAFFPAITFAGSMPFEAADRLERKG